MSASERLALVVSAQMGNLAGHRCTERGRAARIMRIGVFATRRACQRRRSAVVAAAAAPQCALGGRTAQIERGGPSQHMRAVM
jgi:hypothetical protein